MEKALVVEDFGSMLQVLHQIVKMVRQDMKVEEAEKVKVELRAEGGQSGSGPDLFKYDPAEW